MTDREHASFHAVLFDLDDTLLHSDMERTFLRHYFALLTEYARPLCAPQALVHALMTATEQVLGRPKADGRTNEDYYASVLAPLLGKPWEELRGFFDRFYVERFPALRAYTRAHPDARRAVQICLDAGCQVVIATNPIFPARAIEHRMAWAGVDDLPFALVTTYENMHTSKPAPAYYVEIAQRIGVEPGDCLMVGNDVGHDIAPAQLAGMRTFLADEWIVNPDPDVRPDRTGTLQELIDWIADPTLLKG